MLIFIYNRLGIFLLDNHLVSMGLCRSRTTNIVRCFQGILCVDLEQYALNLENKGFVWDLRRNGVHHTKSLKDTFTVF